MKGWAVVFGVVSVIDVHAAVTRKPTLSTSFRRASRRHPYLLTAATAYLVAHLFGLVPHDPLSRLGETA